MDGAGHRDPHADPGAALGDVAPLSALDDPVRRRLYDYVCEQDQPVSRDQASGAAGSAARSRPTTSTGSRPPGC